MIGYAKSTPYNINWLNHCEAVVIWYHLPGRKWIEFEFDPLIEVYNVPETIAFHGEVSLD